MKIQENINAVWNTENISNTDKNMQLLKSEVQTESAYSQIGSVYENTELIDSVYTTYNANGTVNGISATSSTWSNQNIQTALINLGFYSGPANGNLNSDLMRIAIGNFQTVYGLNKTGAMNQTTLSKLQLVDGFRNRAMNILAENENNIQVKDLVDSIERKNFAKIWTFLRLGMGVDATHASAVMANIKAESGFSSDNLQNENGVVTHHDPDYVYNVSDGKGYGIMQWTIVARKQGLLNQAKSMGLQPKDLNAQLAYFRSETNNPSICKSEWAEFKNKKTLTDATEYFLEYIEMPGEDEAHKEDRIMYANQIYQLMYKL